MRLVQEPGVGKSGKTKRSRPKSGAGGGGRGRGHTDFTSGMQPPRSRREEGEKEGGGAPKQLMAPGCID